MEHSPDYGASFVDAFSILTCATGDYVEVSSVRGRQMRRREMLAANAAWADTRNIQFVPGMLGSEIHTGFDAYVLPDIRRALATGRSYSRFRADDTDITKASSTLSVVYRKLENGLIAVEARELGLAEQLADVMGPVLVVDLPDGPNSVPSNFLAINGSFRDMFLSGLDVPVPSISYSAGRKHRCR